MDCPWRAVALLVAVLAQQASAAPCAKVAEQQSNGWLHMDGTKKFSIQLNIEEWLAYENIQLTWPGAQQILIENVFNAQLAAGARPTAELNAQRRQNLPKQVRPWTRFPPAPPRCVCAMCLQAPPTAEITS